MKRRVVDVVPVDDGVEALFARVIDRGAQHGVVVVAARAGTGLASSRCRRERREPDDPRRPARGASLGVGRIRHAIEHLGDAVLANLDFAQVGERDPAQDDDVAGRVLDLVPLDVQPRKRGHWDRRVTLSDASVGASVRVSVDIVLAVRGATVHRIGVRRVARDEDEPATATAPGGGRASGPDDGGRSTSASAGSGDDAERRQGEHEQGTTRPSEVLHMP